MTINPYTADQVESEAVEPLWPIQRPGVQLGSLDWRIGRGMWHFLAGARDKGKGLMMVHIGADMIKAGFNVLHSAIEDSPALMTKPRYQAAGINGDALKRLHLKRFRLPDPAGRAWRPTSWSTASTWSSWTRWRRT